MSAAREEILERVRAATRDVPEAEGPDDVAVARDYRHRYELHGNELIERFAERVADYNATVRRVRREQLGDIIVEVLSARGATKVVVPPDLPGEWKPDGGVEAVVDADLSHEALDSMDGVITGCAVGIAETGTIVIDGGARQGRRAISLLPDYHLCVVESDQVVGGIPEAVARVGETVRRTGRPVTFISGPSATSDIELNRVEGVHGPRTLEVLIVG